MIVYVSSAKVLRRLSQFLMLVHARQHCADTLLGADAAAEAAHVESLNKMSTAELKRYLEARGVSTVGMLERGDLIAAAASLS